MIDFYFHPSPNPLKVALLLEETGLPYRVVPVDTFRGEQHEPGFLEINPNAKVPAIVDGGTRVFDSNAILLHLADKAGRFVPSDTARRGEMLSWLFLVATGLSPFSGQAVHFLHHAPEEVPYAVNRYVREVERHYRVLDDRLAANRYLAGDDYTIADMALWGWLNFAPYILGEKGLSEYSNLGRLFDEMCPLPTRAATLGDGLDVAAAPRRRDPRRRARHGARPWRHDDIRVAATGRTLGVDVVAVVCGFGGEGGDGSIHSLERRAGLIHDLASS